LRRHRVRGGWLGTASAAALLAVLASVVLPGRTLGGGGRSDAHAATPALIGFSFSPRAALYEGQEPVTALRTLVEELTPDLVRLPVYWDGVEATRGLFDFTETDQLIAVIQAYNRSHSTRPTRVILVAGVRNMAYPELYIPAWVPVAERDPAAQMAADPEYHAYLRATFLHYHPNPLVYSWQLENEPLDNVPTMAGKEVSITGDNLQDELELLRSIDSRPAVITTYNSATLSLDIAGLSPSSKQPPAGTPLPAGHPLQALQSGDALGLDLYVVTGDTSLSDANAITRIGWKRAALPYWVNQAQTAGKPLWITEMQGAPWPGLSNFAVSDLLYSADAYRHMGAGVVLLWGVEEWLDSPAWMDAGKQARQILTG
jgi:hypothetical protein